ncbi:MAG: hypothetical protein JWR09_875 [Mucilaginibacter sp.]|nr:hypothetical protein [Mucilaginibacter sp.]
MVWTIRLPNIRIQISITASHQKGLQLKNGCLYLIVDYHFKLLNHIT